MVFTTGKEVTRLVREYGIDSVAVETFDAGATHTVRINFAEEAESLRVYEVTEEDHAIRLAQKLAERFDVDILLPSVVDEDATYDTFYNGSMYGVRKLI